VGDWIELLGSLL